MTVAGEICFSVDTKPTVLYAFKKNMFPARTHDLYMHSTMNFKRFSVE